MIEMLDYVNATFQPIASDSGFDFEVQVLGDVLAEVYPDEQRLQQILRNLLSNAIKFTPAGRVIVIVSEGPGGEVLRGEDVIAHKPASTNWTIVS